MYYSNLVRSIQWILKNLEQDPSFFAKNNAIYVVFSGTLNKVLDHAPGTVCLDVMIGDQWVCYEDCPAMNPDEYKQFRWIVEVF